MANIDKNNNGNINLTEFVTFIMKRETVENEK
jgi:Ca2+-binding EF-hand superfamily protein